MALAHDQVMLSDPVRRFLNCQDLHQSPINGHPVIEKQQSTTTHTTTTTETLPVAAVTVPTIKQKTIFASESPRQKLKATERAVVKNSLQEVINNLS